ncbi:VCBS repeat-containing protein [Micromonospora sp. NPDC050686]|uniref:FG-GAP repeat domain-containing protein n=1 Tax=Micromonospora sp. NPDC050686 TaxID=3154631 RepID=UPI0033D576AB
MNGDNKAELLSIWNNGDIHAYTFNGDVYDGANTIVASGFSDPTRVKYGDVDGDGNAELLNVWSDGNVHAYTFNGSVYDGANSVVAGGFGDGANLNVADIDGNGRVELMATFADGGTRAYWYNTTTKKYDGATSKIIASGFTDPFARKFADIDGDRKAELAGIWGNGDIHAYTYNGSAYDGTNTVVAQGFSSPVMTKFGDIDGVRDSAGKFHAELMATFADGGTRAYWYNTTTKKYDGTTSKIIASGFTKP